MKKLFVLVAKCFGIQVVFQGLLAFAPYAEILRAVPTEPEVRHILFAQGMVVLFALVAGVAMIIYSDKLADLVGASGTIELPQFSSGAFLRVGMILMGMSHILRAAPRIAARLIASSPQQGGLTVNDIVGLALALVLVFRAAHIVGFIERANGQAG